MPHRAPPTILPCLTHMLDPPHSPTEVLLTSADFACQSLTVCACCDTAAAGGDVVDYNAPEHAKTFPSTYSSRW